jgi:predicted RNA binding protein YcfA (HicA-like mRNA interferase family)
VPRIPGVNHLDAVRALEKAGFEVIRQGKHVVMTDGTRQVSIPRHNPIKAFTMGGIVQDAGLTWRSSADSYSESPFAQQCSRAYVRACTVRFGYGLRAWGAGAGGLTGSSTDEGLKKSRSGFTTRLLI